MSTNDDGPVRSLRVEILHVPDCPLVDRLLAQVEAVLEAMACDVQVRLVEGDYPSPTLLVDGLDVTTGAPVAGEPCCRLDLPSSQQVRAALCAVR
jgi:hypothetical protein